MPWGQGRWKGGQPNLAEGGTDTGPADAAQGPAAAGEQGPSPRSLPCKDSSGGRKTDRNPSGNFLNIFKNSEDF